MTVKFVGFNNTSLVTARCIARNYAIGIMVGAGRIYISQYNKYKESVRPRIKIGGSQGRPRVCAMLSYPGHLGSPLEINVRNVRRRRAIFSDD